MDWQLALVAGGVATMLAFRDGGYFPTDWGWSAVVLLCVSAITLVLRDGIAFARSEALMLGALAGFVGWSLLSVEWSTSVERSVLQVERTLVYVAALLAVFIVARGRSSVEVVLAAYATTLVVSIVALAKLFLGQESQTELAYSRLSAPFTYPNALALVAAVGALLSLGFAARAEGRLARGAAAAALVPLALTIFLTFSRSVWLALVAGLVGMLVLDPRREDVIRAAVVTAPFAGLDVWLASDAHGLFEPTTGGSSRDAQLLAVATVVLAAAAAVAASAAAHVRVPVAGAVVIAVLVLGGAAAAVAYLGSASLGSSEGSRALVRTDGNDSTVLSLSGRVPVWGQAWRDWKHNPVLGSGAGTFEQYWLEHRTTAVPVRNAHSLYLETLAELGPVGLALLVAALAVPLACARRARSHPAAPAALGGYVAFLVHAAGDWDWQLPAVTLVSLFCGAALLMAGRGGRPKALTVRTRGAALVALLLVAFFAYDGLVGNGALAASSRAVAAGQWQRAATEARKATHWLPWSSDAWLHLADARTGQNDYPAARADLRRAIRNGRDDWRAWWSLMRLDSGRRRRHELAHAAALNPRAPEVVHFLLAPGSLLEGPSYDDAWRGWPVAPLHRQHPIRSAFLDPRAGALRKGGDPAYHFGIDIAVRDDRPEPGAPAGRTHRVYAIEDGYADIPARRQSAPCLDRRVSVGHFDYWHVDASGVLTAGQRVRAGQLIGWTCKGLGHVHLAEWFDLYGRPVYVNPLRPGGKLAPFDDRQAPRIHAVAFYGPALPSWRARPRVTLPQAGARLPQVGNRTVLSGLVDVRASIDDNAGLPYSIAFGLVREGDGRRMLERTVFRSAAFLSDGFATQPVPIGFHYAPGTTQGKTYWFRLFARPGEAYWRTSRVPNGNYRFDVEARDAAGNVARAAVLIAIRN